ncbi:MAG: hypothetical protein E7124_06370 [Bacteroidales bacterium]|nr:hypothetical protein [Bacteroidales bacterium]
MKDQIIKDFYAGWIAENPEKKMWNEDLHYGLINNTATPKSGCYTLGLETDEVEPRIPLDSANVDIISGLTKSALKFYVP